MIQNNNDFNNTSILLNSSLTDESNEKVVSFAHQLYTSYTLNGVTYRIPAEASTDSQYELNRLVVSGNEYENMFDLKRSDIYFREGGSKVLTVRLYPEVFEGEYDEEDELEESDAIMESVELENNMDRNTNFSVYVFLYRVGTSSAVHHWKLNRSELAPYEVSLTWEATGKLCPGQYFLLITNMKISDSCNTPFQIVGGMLCYPFQILKQGKALKLPCLKRVVVSRPDNVHQVCGTLAALNLKLSCRLFSDDCFSFRLYVYNDEHQSMGEASICKQHICKGGGRQWFYFSITPSCVWTEGFYYLVWVCNEEPYALCKFHWSDHMVSTHAEILPLSSDSLHYLMATYLEKKLTWRTKAGKLPAMKQLREDLIPYLTDTVYRRERIRRGISVNKMARHLVIVGIESRVKHAMIKLLPSLLEFPYLENTVTVVDAYHLIDHKNSLSPYEETDNLFNMPMEKIICLTNVAVLFSSEGAVVWNKIIKALRSSSANFSLFLSVTASESHQLFQQRPELEEFFPSESFLHLSDYSFANLLQALIDHLKKEYYFLSSEAEQVLYTRLKNAYDSGYLHGWGEREIDDFSKRIMLPAIQKRMIKKASVSASSDASLLQNLLPEDLAFDFKSRTAVTFIDSMKPLNEMVGLSNLKQQLTKHFQWMCVQQMRQQVGLPIADTKPCHMIFTGNPGTGKTTVAQLIGKIYHSLGFLSKGEVIQVDRARIIGQYIGETEKNMREILENARGNVLFIDEAYTLNVAGDNRRDFGLRAIEMLLPVLADPHCDMLLIMAGYEKEMQEMLHANQGLAGRIPYNFHFPDYSADELFTIGMCLLKKGEYSLTQDAEYLFKKKIEEAVNCKDAFFSNARWMEQVIHSGILPAMAKRLIDWRVPLLREELSTILPQDIEQGMFSFLEAVVPKCAVRQIGFR